MSNVRHAVAGAFPDGSATVRTSASCHQLVLPADTVVDAEAAMRRIDAAEGALRRQDVGAAWADATVAGAIARRPLLAGEEGRWVEQVRDELAEVLLRSCACLHAVWTARGDHATAARTARTCVSLAPFRESGYRRLMSSLAASGDRAEALRVYEECRRLLLDELGTDPSPQTRAVHQRVRSGTGGAGDLGDVDHRRRRSQ